MVKTCQNHHQNNYNVHRAIQGEGNLTGVTKIHKWNWSTFGPFALDCSLFVPTSAIHSNSCIKSSVHIWDECRLVDAIIGVGIHTGVCEVGVGNNYKHSNMTSTATLHSLQYASTPILNFHPSALQYCIRSSTPSTAVPIWRTLQYFIFFPWNCPQITQGSKKKRFKMANDETISTKQRHKKLKTTWTNFGG